MPAGQRSAAGRLTRNPSWPITALLVGYPLWWALGIADLAWIILAVPMTMRMLAWRLNRSRALRVPPGFGIWLLFLICVVAGLSALTLTAPGTVASPVLNRALSFTNRTGAYIGVTILLLYAGNLSEYELSRRRLAWLLGLVAIYTTLGGVAGMLMPHLQFSSPLLLLLPHSAQGNAFIQAATHPSLAQVQNVLGTAKGRPKAPFDYTNTWANCLTILLPWLLVGWWSGGTRRQRLIAASVIAVAWVPLLYSLNRAAWAGAGVAIAFVAVRLMAKRRRAALGVLCVATALAGIVVLAGPLRDVVTARLAHPKSDQLRASLDALAVSDALASPVIGYGDTRKQRGSWRSIAVGPTAKCAVCGHVSVGSTGQLWLLLICDGFVGTVLYLGFFAAGIWRYRRDRTPYGIAGALVLLLSFLYMFTYDAVPAPLGFTMLAYALLWRNEAHHRRQRARRAAVGRQGRVPRQRGVTAEMIG